MLINKTSLSANIKDICGTVSMEMQLYHKLLCSVWHFTLLLILEATGLILVSTWLLCVSRHAGMVSIAMEGPD